MINYYLNFVFLGIAAGWIILSLQRSKRNEEYCKQRDEDMNIYMHALYQLDYATLKRIGLKYQDDPVFYKYTDISLKILQICKARIEQQNTASWDESKLVKSDSASSKAGDPQEDVSEE